MITKDELVEFYASIKDVNYDEVDIFLIIKEIFDFIVDINFNLINTDQSVTRHNDETNCYEIKLIGKSNERCNLFFEISEKNVININIGKGYGEFLFSQEILNMEDVYKLRNALNDLFTASIKEKLVYCNDKLIKCEYTIMYEVDGEILPNHFSSHYGSCWFWQTKWEKENFYNPWIKKE